MTTALLYHAATCQLVGIAPTLSAERLALLGERERVCGAHFPVAIKEWYALEDTQGGGSRLVPLAALGDPEDTSRNFVKIVAGDMDRYEHALYARLGSEQPEIRAVEPGIALADAL